MSEIVLAVLVFFVEAFLHYFPWRLVMGGRELPRVVAYALGVAGMMIPFTFWLAQEGWTAVAWALWGVIVSAGAAVALMYLLDWVVGLAWTTLEARQREAAALAGLKNAINAKE